MLYIIFIEGIFIFFHSNLWITCYVPGTGTTYGDTKPNKVDVLSIPIKPIVQLQIGEHIVLLRTIKEVIIALL